MTPNVTRLLVWMIFHLCTTCVSVPRRVDGSPTENALLVILVVGAVVPESA
jgi:hypothetical protein